MTAKSNLLKLMEAGFVEPEKDNMDKRTRYFKIADKKA
jgi:predicted transcriptional regulator